MVSYFKTQWPRFICGVICMIIAFSYMFSPAVDLTTLEGIVQDTRTFASAVAWTLTSVCFFVMSFVEWIYESIKKLIERIEALEKLNSVDN
jgi:hypothetical protein